MISLNQEIEQFLLDRGALKVGFASSETLSGGPPSVDITYPLPEARSVLCFSVPLNREITRAYLRKDLPNGCKDHETDNIETNIKAYKLAISAANYLKEKGFKAVAVFPNFKYREELPGWELNMYPELCLRYIAMRSGAGSVGWSGNIGLKGYGTAIILGGLVTSAELEPTAPIPPEESFCTKCKLCSQVCAYRMFDHDNEDSITLGGITFSFSKRINIARCQIVCGGLSGLDKTGNWSTWSPGRYPYPETNQEVMRTLSIAVNNFLKWPEIKIHETFNTSEFENDKEISEALGENKEKMMKMIKDVKLTCGNCQLICWGDPKETKENYNLLINSGCVLQKEDGKIEILPPGKAKRAFNAMNPKHQKLYYKKIRRSSK